MTALHRFLSFLFLKDLGWILNLHMLKLPRQVVGFAPIGLGIGVCVFQEALAVMSSHTTLVLLGREIWILMNNLIALITIRIPGVNSGIELLSRVQMLARIGYAWICHYLFWVGGAAGLLSRLLLLLVVRHVVEYLRFGGVGLGDGIHHICYTCWYLAHKLLHSFRWLLLVIAIAFSCIVVLYHSDIRAIRAIAFHRSRAITGTSSQSGRVIPLILFLNNPPSAQMQICGKYFPSIRFTRVHTLSHRFFSFVILQIDSELGFRLSFHVLLLLPDIFQKFVKIILQILKFLCAFLKLLFCRRNTFLNRQAPSVPTRLTPWIISSMLLLRLASTPRILVGYWFCIIKYDLWRFLGR